LTGGFDDGYGSGSSSQVPTEGPEEERSTHSDIDGAGQYTSEVDRDASDPGEIPRHSRPFRAWGAAHERETGPSFWERFVTWLRSAFSRSRAGEIAAGEEIVAEEYVEPEEYARLIEPATPKEELPIEAEAPSDADFASEDEVETDVLEVEAAQDDKEEQILRSAQDDNLRFAQDDKVAEADPIWDAPVVAEAAVTPAPTLEAHDFADVWSPREEEAPPAETLFAEETVVAEEPKKGFFARLFSRKKKEPAPVTDEHREAAAAWESEVAEIDRAQSSELEPADADFADNPAAAAVPDEEDFAADYAADPAPTPSIDHSAADAANLAALLGPITPREPVEDAPTQMMESAVDEPLEEPVAEVAFEEPVAETPFEEAVADAPIEEPGAELPVEEPLLDLPVEAPLPVVPPPAKKAGFFSGLLQRVSRSQFIPKLEPEPEPEPVAELEPVVEPEVEEPVALEEVAEAEEPAAAAEIDSLFETVPTPMPAVPPPAAFKPPPPPPEHELQATQPFPAFRDARDDFADEEKPAESGRPTEQVEIPAFDEGEKTDEFEAVPIAAEAEPGTMETRQVAGFFGRLFGTQAEEKAPTPDSAEVAATQAAVDEKMPFVLAKFRTFYNEVIRDKHQRSDVISGFATAVMGSGSASEASDPEFAAQLLSKRLSEMLELQAAESNWTGGDAAKYYPEAQYAMVALADETFATTDWPGRSSWHKYMLEPRMYGTRGADLDFFKRIDKLLKEAPQDKGARDLARLYLMVIASGFRGKFRVPNVRRPLAEYRRRLYEYSHQADPLDLYARERRIIPDVMEHTMASRAVGRFTSAQRWIATVLILVILYLGISHYAWSRLTADLKDVMSRIENTGGARTP
jgi:type IV/VI secretion system ImpK/VasF family protein